MPSLPTRLGDMVYQIKGQGIPVIMLHATLHDRHNFDGIVTRLAENYLTITADWPWHGESKGLDNIDELGAVALADALEDFMAGLNLPPAYFIGNSVGGFASARLAITHPHLVRGLVLVNPGGFVHITGFARFFCRVLGTPFFSRFLLPVLVTRYMAPQTAADETITRETKERARTVQGAAVAAAIWRSFPDPGHDLVDRGPKITAPTLIVWGTQDPTFPADTGKAVQRCIPGSKLELFDAGHVVFSSKPDEFLALVEPFFESSKGAGGADGESE